jgi:hypothetical protein
MLKTKKYYLDYQIEKRDRFNLSPNIDLIHVINKDTKEKHKLDFPAFLTVTTKLYPFYNVEVISERHTILMYSSNTVMDVAPSRWKSFEDF